MGLLDFLNTGKKEEPVNILAEKYDAEMAKFANFNYNPIFTYSYTGEKTPGEIGTIRNYVLNYGALRARSWQSYLESEITQTVVNKYLSWIIGKGLKLESEPVEAILSANGITINTEEFISLNEARFGLFSRSTESDYSKLDNLNRLAFVVKKQALLGGDCLIVLRVIKGKMNVQIIDAGAVTNPLFDSADLKLDRERGNKIENGIVTNKKGEIIAFYVRENDRTFKRIKARSARGFFQQAFYYQKSLVGQATRFLLCPENGQEGDTAYLSELLSAEHQEM